MIECREIVDSVKADISSASPGINMVTSDMGDKGTDVKIVLDKDGNICRECTDLQVSHWSMTNDMKNTCGQYKFSLFQAEFAKNPGGVPPKRAGLIIASVVGGLGLAITSVCVPFVLPALRCVTLINMEKVLMSK